MCSNIERDSKSLKLTLRLVQKIKIKCFRNGANLVWANLLLLQHNRIILSAGPTSIILVNP